MGCISYRARPVLEATTAPTRAPKTELQCTEPDGYLMSPTGSFDWNWPTLLCSCRAVGEDGELPGQVVGAKV